MDLKLHEICDKYIDENMEQLIISNSYTKQDTVKIKVRPLLLHSNMVFQASEYTATQVFHHNYTKAELLEQLSVWFGGLFKQGELKNRRAAVTILVSKKGTVTVKCREIAASLIDAADFAPPASHNRVKQYILQEGTPITFLIKLGVMTPEGKVVNAQYDKFRQINRFLEFVEDILPELANDRTIRILDFGCGKSYLTFAIYYYLHILKKRDVRITGLDLKKDVIRKCNELKDFCGYDGLEFIEGDIAGYEGEDKVDMVVTLHACDTATDYALQRAVRWNSDVILSVPCCQHEWNSQWSSNALEPLLNHGIIKERMAALMTDAMRSELLECCGYKVQVLEFIDMEHTPKNLMIRAVKRSKDIDRTKRLDACISSMNSFGVTPKLYELLREDGRL